MQTRRVRPGLAVLVAALALLLGACGDDGGSGGGGGGNGDDALGDPVLEEGSSIYSENCARCHGPDGEGGVGPQLGDGQVAEAYPEIEDQIEVITNGRGGMPAFEGNLSEDEIEAVARFEREALGQ